MSFAKVMWPEMAWYMIVITVFALFKILGF